MTDTTVFGVEFLALVSLKTFDDLPGGLVTLQSIFHQSGRTDPAFPVLIIVFSVMCILS